MSDEPKLPLRVVPALTHDFYKPENGGGKRKHFIEVTREVRERLASQVANVRDYFSDSFREFPDVPAVMRVKLKSTAIAKTHRPSEILSARTCPIIGTEALGLLLVSASSAGLERLARQIETSDSNVAIANISTFESFEPFIPLPYEFDDTGIKLKLFRHHNFDRDSAIEDAFRSIVGRSKHAHPLEIRYANGLKIFRIENCPPVLAETLYSYVGTQSVGPFPKYYPVRSTAIPIRAANEKDFPAPNPDLTYPIVGLIDSGTNPADSHLAAWRVARYSYVPEGEQDNTHGSFVAGLLVHPKLLNHNDARFPSTSSQFVDIVALSKHGSTEDALLSAIEDALERFPYVKTWNLSLGTNAPINDHVFSDFACALDELQRLHNATFILASGNYTQPPFRGWPPEELGGADRICAPADSLRSIVVGAISHRDHATARVPAGVPSPFSRRGPGPLYLPKPEICHVGGNCDGAGACSQIGVLSVDGKGNVAEDLGTSFATPIASNLFANVGHVISGQLSPLMARALLVHSAALRGGKIDPQLLPYRGFGIPGDLSDVLACRPWECTMTFEIGIEPGVSYQKAQFPMPPSLYVAKDTVRASIVMTLVHDPEMDGRFGSEYCRSNIDVSLGTYDAGTDGRRHQKKRIPEDPKLVGEGYEIDLVKHGFKWSPVKVYRRNMKVGVAGELWRLDLAAHHRSGHVPADLVRAALVITIGDPLKRAPVYNEMVAAMNALGWQATDLVVQAQVRAAN